MPKKIVYTAIDNGIDGMQKDEVVIASFDEHQLKALYNIDNNKNWLRLNEEIIDTDTAKKKALAKLDAIDKLVLKLI
jgi:hypothetical protein